MPSESCFEPHSPRYGQFLVEADNNQCGQILGFWGDFVRYMIILGALFTVLENPTHMLFVVLLLQCFTTHFITLRNVQQSLL